MGITIASVALAYDGAYPVNLLSLFGVLILVPTVLLLVTILAGLAQDV